jgi:DNA-binding response OmpR family regulator
MQVLIIADAAAGPNRIAEKLAAARVATRVTTPGAAEAALDEGVDGVVIDTGDLAGTGLPLLRRFRDAGHKLPLLLVGAGSAHAETEAFNLGADAVVPRGVPAATMLARIEAIRRRAPARKVSGIRCGNVSIDRESGLLNVAGQPVEVTPCELRVLDMLMGARGGVLGKERICDALREGEGDAAPGVLRVFVCRLRRKLAEAGADDIIRTVWGVGYRVEAPCSGARPGIGNPVAAFGATH